MWSPATSIVHAPAAAFVVCALIAAACGGSAPAGTSGSQPVTESTRYEISVGAPPAEGWRWVVGEIKTGSDQRTVGTDKHADPWLFYVVAGSAEVVTDKKSVLTAGAGMWLPAQTMHSHTFATQTRSLVLQLKAKAPDKVHDADRLLVSAKPFDIAGGVSYTLRVREITLAAGAKAPDGIAQRAGAAYVIDGTLTTVGGTPITVDAGKAFEWPGSPQSVAAGAGGPARFVLFDLR